MMRISVVAVAQRRPIQEIESCTAHVRLFALVATLAVAPLLRAEDAYYSLSLEKLTITDGQMPHPGTAAQRGGNGAQRQRLQPRAVVDGVGEAFVNPLMVWQPPPEGMRLSVRAPAGKDVTGLLFMPNADWTGMVRLKFKIPTGLSEPAARQAFHVDKIAHYERLIDAGVPGAAWFRHEIRAEQIASGEKVDDNTQIGPRPVSSNELLDSFALFTGGRAISENIQLDRLLPPVRGAELVDVETIEGITVPEIDWTKLTEGLSPEVDPLAALIPADQHAVFFANFNAFTRVADEARRNGTPVLRLAEPQATDAKTLERYEQQLCLSLTGVARLIGPGLVRSVALTGSDANFRTGTDLAILFDTTQPDVLERLLLAQVALATANNKEVERAPGEINGLRYEGSRSPHREVSCYIAKLDRAVVVANSLYQLERLAAVTGGKTPALAGLPEYKFFRDRYRRGDQDETALVFLSDATIRRWCGPRWRIASSRQLRDLAVVTELTATYMDALAKNNVQPGPIHTDLPFASAGQITLTQRGVASSTIGALEFLTPIAEMHVDKVTRAEAEAYDQWRRGYQRNWRWAFDPIALRLSVSDEKLAADLSVMPLIWGSDYREMVAVTQGAEIKPGAGDPHDDVAHFVMSFNAKSPTVREASNFASTMAPGIGVEPLSWIGQSIAIYADDDPAWAELAKVAPEKWETDFPSLAAKLPIAIWFEVGSPLKATAFMTAARAFIEQTAPGMAHWEALSYKDKPYVKVSASEEAGGNAAELRNLAVYYTLSGDSLTLSLSENVIQRALDRRIAREQNAGGAPAAATAWLGQNVAARADRKLLDVISAVTRDRVEQAMQALAWGNLPILNEWNAPVSRS